ncbi:MAG: nitrogen utilization protein B [Peptococcaceae bacterium BRH_c4b]|nr:MAG: nitrogen utilization protein B [Peptococcaceae bacterium BRH_c4b]
MGRRQSREVALQALFQVDVGKADPEYAVNYLALDGGARKDDIDFARELVMGTLANLQEIDRIIALFSKDWQMERMARVDRNIMRISVYELMHRDDIPPGVSVNEAVELAKLFGGEDSAKFVNGILGQVVTLPGATGDKEDSEVVQRTET